MFGKKKPVRKTGGTVLILDIESGSVAAALVDTANGKSNILSYQRQQLPLTQSRSGGQITKALEGALDLALRHSAEVAARMRVHAPDQKMGTLTGAVVFLAAPWGTPNLQVGKSSYVPGIREYIQESIYASFGDLHVSFFTSADSILYGSRAIGKHQDALAISLRGEIIELLLLNGKGANGYSTLPLGTRSVLRTLQSHGTLTEHEARSMLHLTKHRDDLQYEPLLAAGRHLGDIVAEGVELLLPAGNATSVTIVGEQPLGEWFAKNIAENPRVSALFSDDSTVEAFMPIHIKEQVAHGAVHDPFVLLEALFLKGVY